MPYDHQTSGVAYHEAPKESRDYCRQMVLITIRKMKVCNDRQIGEHLGWAINRVTPRRGELVEQGIIVLDRKAVDPATGRMTSYWKEKPPFHQPVLF